MHFRRIEPLVEAVYFDGTSDTTTDVFNFIGLPTDDNIILHNHSSNKEGKTTYQFIRYPVYPDLANTPFERLYPGEWLYRGPKGIVLRSSDEVFRRLFERESIIADELKRIAGSLEKIIEFQEDFEPSYVHQIFIQVKGVLHELEKETKHE